MFEGYSHPFREGRVITVAHNDLEKNATVIGVAPGYVVVKTTDTGIIRKLDLYKSGTRMVEDACGSSVRQRKVRQRLLGGGAVASMTKLAKDGLSQNSERLSNISFKGGNNPPPDIPDMKKGHKLLIQDKKKLQRWKSVEVLDIRDGQENEQPTKHILVKFRDNTRVWLDAFKDKDRIKKYEAKPAPVAAETIKMPEEALSTTAEKLEQTTPTVATPAVMHQVALDSLNPVEVVGGLMVEAFDNTTGNWLRVIIESIDPASNAITVSYMGEGYESSTEVITLEHGDSCRIRSTKKGSVSLGGVIYTSTTQAAEWQPEEFEESTAWNHDNVYKPQLELPMEKQGSGFHYSESTLSKAVDSPLNRMRRSYTCMINVSGSDLRDDENQKSTVDDLAYYDVQQQYYGDYDEQQYSQNYQNRCESETLCLGWRRSFYANLSGGLQGLANLGNTCFMNAVLQALQHVGPLVEAILELNFSKTRDSKKHKLVTAVYQMMQRQWYNEGENAFRPLSIKRLMSKSASQFAGNRQHDSQEFLVFLLDSMHEELNKVTVKTYTEIKDDDTADDNQLSEIWWQNYSISNDSFIKDLFVGQMRSRVTCKRCNRISTAFDPFWNLSIPLPPGISCQDSTTVVDCLHTFTQPESLSGDNKFYCGACKDFTDSTKQISIYRCPKVLVLHLKRFTSSLGGGSGKMKTTFNKLGCPVSPTFNGLDLRQFCASTAHYDNYGYQEPLIYNLVAVVNHMGATGSSGHYTADCYEPIRNGWFNYDDSHVQSIESIGINESHAYVLFYVRE